MDRAGGTFGEDLHLYVELQLTAKSFAKLEAAAQQKGYFQIRRPLLDDSIPVDFIDGRPNAPMGFGTAVRALVPGTDGWFLGKGNEKSGSVVIVDPTRRRLHVNAWII